MGRRWRKKRCFSELHPEGWGGVSQPQKAVGLALTLAEDVACAKAWKGERVWSVEERQVIPSDQRHEFGGEVMKSEAAEASRATCSEIV